MESSRTLAFVASLGRRFFDRFKESVLGVQEYVLLSWSGLAAFTPPRYLREIVAQMDSLGVGSLSIVILTGMFTGMVLTLQSAASLDAFGARPYVGRLVCVSMVRELGPVLTALMVTGRVGSGMAAELGSMVVTQQIDALRVLGTDPVRRLVAPRSGPPLMIPILTVISNALGHLRRQPDQRLQPEALLGVLLASVANALGYNDLIMGLTKPVVFGFILATVRLLHGPAPPAAAPRASASPPPARWWWLR